MNRIPQSELIDYLAGELSPEREAAVEAACTSDPDTARELASLRQLREATASVTDPEPSPAADQRFAKMLAGYGESTESPTEPAPRPASVRHLRPVALLGMAASLMLLVFGLGWYFGRSDTSELERQLAATRTLMLELMEAEQPTTRMRAATVSLEVEVADPVIIRNLGHLLRTDEKANVRLAALDALVRFESAPAARDEMLAAMAGDPPPAVRVQLLETLVALNEKRVLPYLEEIINNDRIPRPLRDAAELGTFKLI
ncbi:HEAT repeat protein [Neolewinella xylanilytica]|uniref:HEAT repeat protein n=1 Tax=Neolewinella xylanilytica TaxID=1514080 RepID=A0A2S6I8J1_9BACT|nr:HEAT repeat domain-containing protein [Neolewinella xylanilytica]PPK87798.1 HEAT repeat protein [Neolewinella xylanilytica]